MRFIKCLSVLSFAVGDREGCRTAPVEPSSSSVPVLGQMSFSFQLVVSFASRVSLLEGVAEAALPVHLQIAILYI